MRLGVALALVLVLSGAGCGHAHRAATSTAGRTTPVHRATTTTAAASTGLRVGAVGPLALDAPGTVVDHGSLEQVAGAPLVLVSRGSTSLEAVVQAARSHPASHFALVGESTKSAGAPNLVGLVLSEAQAAQLGGVVAGYAAAEAGGAAPRVAWVGPVDRPLADAFASGVHRSLPGAVVLNEWSRSIPARCKEAALGAIARGAMVVMANGGLCALAAVSGAREQNVPGLRLANFEFPSVAANLVARDAVAGHYHGGEDLLFGARSGAIGIGNLDPRISFPTLVRARASAQVLAGGGR